MESWKPKLTNYRSKGNAVCKKHPKHKQSPGVCSICLTEKLSQLSSSGDSSSSSKSALSSSSSSSSSYVSSLSSSDVSSCSSPVLIFNKSRSVAFVSQNGGGFWSKLLPKSRKLMHSRTMMIERVTAAVH